MIVCNIVDDFFSNLSCSAVVTQVAKELHNVTETGLHFVVVADIIAQSKATQISNLQLTPHCQALRKMLL